MHSDRMTIWLADSNEYEADMEQIQIHACETTDPAKKNMLNKHQLVTRPVTAYHIPILWLGFRSRAYSRKKRIKSMLRI